MYKKSLHQNPQKVYKKARGFFVCADCPVSTEDASAAVFFAERMLVKNSTSREHALRFYG
jgi:hypothetical protein